MTDPKPKKPVEPKVEHLVVAHNLGPHVPVLMGCDMSLTSSGVGVIDGEEMHVYRIRPGDLRGLPRLQFILNTVVMIVRQHQPAAFCIEGYSLGSQNSHAHSLGELGGLIKYSLSAHGLAMFIAPPGSWKKAITGKGTGLGKGAVTLALFKQFGIELQQDDMADGAAIAVTCAMMTGNYLPETKAQMDGLKKIEAVPSIAPPARPRTRVEGQPAPAPGRENTQEKVATGLQSA